MSDNTETTEKRTIGRWKYVRMTADAKGRGFPPHIVCEHEDDQGRKHTQVIAEICITRQHEDETDDNGYLIAKSPIMWDYIDRKAKEGCLEAQDIMKK